MIGQTSDKTKVEPANPTDRDLATDVRLLVLGVTVMTAASFLLPGPLILPDESSFLLGAYRALGQLDPSGFGYHPGYSLLLAPVAAVSDNLSVVFRMVQVINGALALLTAVLVRSLVIAVRPSVSSTTATHLALIVVAYPAFRVFAAMALSENLLIPATVGLSLLFVRVIGSDDPRSRELVVLGLASGLTFVVHARAIVVPLAVLAGAVVALRGRYGLIAKVAVGVAVGVIVSFLIVQSQVALNGIVVTSSDSRLTLGGMLKANATASALYTLPFTALGQVFYLSIASLGLLPVAVQELARNVRETRALPTTPLATLGLFLGPLLAGSLLVSALFLNEQTGDQAIYGRYMEGVIASTLMVGLVTLVTQAEATRSFLLKTAALLPTFAFILVVARGIGVFNGRQQLVNITGVYPVVRLTGALKLSSLTIAGVLVVLALVYARRHRQGPALLFVVAVFAGVSLFDLQQAAAARPGLAAAVRVGDLAAEIAEDYGVDCIAIDQEDLDDAWQTENYRLAHLDLNFQHWSSRSRDAPCSDVVISARTEIQREQPGAVLLEIEGGWAPMLWVLPGDVQEGLRQDGVELSDRPFQRLDGDSSFAMRIDLVDEDGNPTDQTVYESGDIVYAVVRIANLGRQELVPTAGAERSGGANVGLEWRHGEDPELRLAEPLRLKGLDEILFQGDAVEVPFVIRVASRGEELFPGPYLLRAEIVIEDIEWTNFAATTAITIVPPSDD